MTATQKKLPLWLAIVRHVTRLDARSLGLFRIALGLVLIADLWERKKYVVEFYSNEGVLPNHTHMNGLRQDGKSVWSAFHAFNSAGEARVGMWVVLFIYACFTLGWKTRATQILSLVAFVSLGARNLLTESWGNWLGASVLAFAVALPLGSRFGIDAFLKASRDATEVDADDLNRRTSAGPREIDAHRAPGWSPMSLAAVGFLLQLVIVYVCLAVNQADAWKDGAVLEKLLGVKRLASPLGFGAAKSLGGLAKAFYYAQLAIPALLFVPVLRGWTRLAAAIAILAHGLFIGLFFNFGAFGWILAATSFAVLSSDMWDDWATRFKPSRARTVIYDADCGVCFWLAKLLKRWDAGRHLTFQGNDAIFVARGVVAKRAEKPENDETDEADDAGEADGDAPDADEAAGEVDAGSYWIVRPDGTRSTKPLPTSVTRELVDQTIVVIDADGRVYTEGSAVIAILQALPGFRLLALLTPTFLLDFFYRILAPRRTAVSVACGLDACGATAKPLHHAADPLEAPVAPSRRLRQTLTTVVREGYAVVILGAVLVQTGIENPKFPVKIGRQSTLESVAWYMRLVDRWDVLAEVPATQGFFVTDAATQDGTVVDTFTGRTPVVDFGQPYELGQLWSDYTFQLLQNPKYQATAYQGYMQQFKVYLQKSGPKWNTEAKEKKIVALDAYWFSTTVPATETTATRVHRIGKGGTVLAESVATAQPSQPTALPGGPLPSLPNLRPRPQPQE